MGKRKEGLKRLPHMGQVKQEVLKGLKKSNPNKYKLLTSPATKKTSENQEVVLGNFMRTSKDLVFINWK